MLIILSKALILLYSLALISFAVVAIKIPLIAKSILSKFASTAKLHVLEMLTRILMGLAFVLASSDMFFSDFYNLFGEVLIITSLILLTIPWRWHQRFAKRVVQPLLRHIWVFAVFSFSLGGFILVSIFPIRL